MNIAIRTATEADAPRLLEIYKFYVETTAITFEYDVPTLAEFERRIRTISAKYPYLVLEDDGVIKGYAYAGAFKERAAYDWAVETTIYLDRDAQKCGYGRMLYEALEEQLKEMGITNLYACIAYADPEDEHLTNNSPEFHEHLGYTLAGRYHKCGYKFGRWYDMVWMEKIIAAHLDEQPQITAPAILR